MRYRHSSRMLKKWMHLRNHGTYLYSYISCIDLSFSDFLFEVNNFKEEEKKKERKASRYDFLVSLSQGNVNIVL